MDTVVVYIINSKLVKDNLEKVSSFVSNSRRMKASSFAKEKDRLLSLGAAYLIKKYLPEKDIKEANTGKPYIEGGPNFNISHPGEYSLLAIHPSRELGVDIEQINEDKLGAIRYTLSDVERVETDPETLFKMWSNKESLTKCTSRGLTDIKKVPALPLEGIREVNSKIYFTKSFIYNGCSLSITLEGDEPYDIVIKEINSLEID